MVMNNFCKCHIKIYVINIFLDFINCAPIAF